MFRRFGSAVLRAPEGEPAGGGGGNSDDEAKPVFSDEQFAALHDVFNKALSNRLPKMVSGAFAESIKGVNWKEVLSPHVTELLPKPAPAADDDGGGKPKGTKGAPAVDPEIARQLQKLTDDFEKEKKLREQAQLEAANIKSAHEFSAARHKLYEGLKGHASETLHDVWVDNLIHHKRLKVEEGNAFLEVEYAPAKGMPKQREFLPVEEAIPHLIAHEEAKRFLPAPSGEGGSGNPGPRSRAGSNAPKIDSKNPAERVRARLAAMGIDADKEFS